MDFFSENFNIYLKNLSVVYVSSMTALACAAVAIVYFVVSNNIQGREVSVACSKFIKISVVSFLSQSAQKKSDKHSDSEGVASDPESDDDELTPAKNLIGRLKTAKLKLLEESMTEEQKQAEKE
jgi:hypothetical protein